MTTPQDLDENLRSKLDGLAAPDGVRPDPTTPVRDGSTLTGTLARQILEAQFTSRHLDLAARWLRSFDAGFYTVGSSGHEGNAAVAAALRPTDPALPHYRSGGFYCARAGQVAGTDPVRDVLRSLVASANDQATGGRHKVFANPDLNILPTTATAASHLPRAVGLAFALELAGTETGADAGSSGGGPGGGGPGGGGAGGGGASGGGSGATGGGGGRRWPADALVVCSFGDASVNHANATAAFNAAGWLERSGKRLPLLLVCEDNGLGVSVRSPDGWVADTLRFRPGLRYFAADGCDVVAAYETADRAIAWVRKHRRPAVLHLTTVRLMGHSGEDAEQLYRTVSAVGADLTRDPVVATARLLVEGGYATAQELLARYDEIGWQVRRTAEEVLTEPRLGTISEIIAPVAPRRPVGVAKAVVEAGTRVTAAGVDRTAAFGGRLPEEVGPLTLVQAVNAALADGLLAHPEALVLGADVGAKGGGYGVTKGLQERFGKQRVLDTLLDPTSILGLGLGAGVAGALPIPEISYLASLHGAEEQLRGEAATLQFFSRGAYRNPMVVRVPGLAHQEVGADSFRNDNALAALRDIPGLVLAVPARAADAAPMLRTCLAAAAVDGTVSVFLEPIGLYHARDLHEEGDGRWQSGYAPPADWGGVHIPIGKAGVFPEGGGNDLTIITFGNGVRLSLRVAHRLADEGVGSRVLDLRWLAPLPLADIMREASATGRVLVVDETRRSGGVGEGVLAVLVDTGYEGAVRRIAAVDTFVPFGPAAEHVLISEEQIMQGARSLLAH